LPDGEFVYVARKGAKTYPVQGDSVRLILSPSAIAYGYSKEDRQKKDYKSRIKRIPFREILEFKNLSGQE